MPQDPIIRVIEPADSISELTQLLHRAYGALARRGMHFVASHQNDEMTRKRISEGECYVAIDGGKLVGTITWSDAKHTNGSPWLDRTDVASFGQFAVEPALQGRGIGSRLLAVAERRTVESGASELCLNTAETAHDLIAFYSRREYRFIEHVQWTQLNYRSVILSKTIAVAANGQ